MNTGVHFDIPFDDYRAINAANKSGLDLVARSPRHYQAALRAGEKTTPARLLGTAIHTAVLEPNELTNRYVVLPDDAPRRPTPAQRNAKKPSPETIEACEFWDKFTKEALEKQIISADDYQTCVNIAHTLRQKPQHREFFSSGTPEVTLIWEREGVLCKARADWVTEGAIVDVKSTLSAEKHDFLRDIYNYGYHRQAAWYLDGYRALTGEDVLFVIAAVEKEEPFESNFFFMPEEAVHVGRLENDKAFERYKQASETGDWCGYPPDLIRAEAPAWVIKRAGDL
jgi:exodeoxyribonuclease VIII